MSTWGLLALALIGSGGITWMCAHPVPPLIQRAPAPPVVVHESDALPPTRIDVKDVAADTPEFRREYRARLNEHISIKVTLRNSYGGSRYDDSELDQNDGKWVLFDVHAPADKILDRELLPIVQQYCDAILQLDADFIRSDPSQFTDEKNRVWRRVE